MTPSQSEIAHLYSKQQAEYTKFASESFSWLYLEKPAFERHLTQLLTSQTKVIDAGCGTGRTLVYLLSKGVPPKNITGVDINSEMLQISSSVTPPGTNLLLSDLEQLPLPDNSNDLIICTHVLHYFDNPKYLETMREFRRVLRTGGTLFTVITHPMRTSRNDLSHYFHRCWIMDQTPWGTQSPLYFRPTSDLVNLALESGFKLQVFDELEVDPAGQLENPAEYERYISCPPRLALVLRK